MSATSEPTLGLTGAQVRYDTILVRPGRRLLTEPGGRLESLVERVSVADETLIDHPAFTEPVRIMPDTHWGAGAPIGFTMPLSERVVPNIVGVDVGCGMAATNLGPQLPLEDAERERRVREAVPMGRSVHDYDDAVHFVEAFPFERANRIFEQFDTAYAERFGEHIDPVEFDFNGYDGEYFESL